MQNINADPDNGNLWFLTEVDIDDSSPMSEALNDYIDNIPAAVPLPFVWNKPAWVFIELGYSMMDEMTMSGDDT